MMRLSIWLFAFFLFSRAFIYFIIGVSPNSVVITTHWQNLDIGDLNESLFLQIINLHSQAPLWNILLGVSAKTCSADLLCATAFLHILFIFFTFLICLVIVSVLVDLGASLPKAFLVSAAFSVLPATIYYENYPFYPHITALLCSLSAYGFYNWLKYRNIKHQVVFMLSTACLSLTWGLFHPALISLVLVSTTIVIRAFNVRALTVSATAIFLAFSPSVKNFHAYDFFGGSSWLGLNMSQVAPNMPQHCSFSAHRQELQHIEHNGTAYNDVSIISRSQECKDLAISNILSSPFEYIKGRIRAVISSTMRTPSDYFYRPNGFTSYPRFSGFTTLRNDVGKIDYSSVTKGVTVFASNIFGFFSLIYFCFVGDRQSKSLALLGLVFLLFVFVVGHAANGGEQERFRYSVMPFLFVSTLCLMRQLMLKLRKSMR